MDDSKKSLEEIPTDTQVLRFIERIFKAPAASLDPGIIDLVTECQEIAAENGSLAEKLSSLKQEEKKLQEALVGNSIALVRIAKIIYRKEEGRKNVE